MMSRGIIGLHIIPVFAINVLLINYAHHQRQQNTQSRLQDSAERSTAGDGK